MMTRHINLYALTLITNNTTSAQAQAYNTYIAPLQLRFYVTDRAGVQPTGRAVQARAHGL